MSLLGDCPFCNLGNSGRLYQPIIETFTIGRFCSDCGAELVWKCFTCNGTGIVDRGYCSHCGRKKSDTCSSCNGTGETRDRNHICLKKLY